MDATGKHEFQKEQYTLANIYFFEVYLVSHEVS